MKERLIIENRTGMPMVQAMEYAQSVVREGKISGDGDKAQYCYATTFDNGIVVWADKNKASDRLVVEE